MQSTSGALRPGMLRPSRMAVSRLPRRAIAVRASAFNYDDHRASLGAAVVSGVALFVSPAISAPLPDVPEPMARPFTVESTSASSPAPNLGPGAEAPKLRPAAPLTPATPLTLDPKVLGGGAAAAVVAVAGLAMMGQNQGGDEIEAEADVNMSPQSVKKEKKAKQLDLTQLKQAEETLNVESNKLQVLEADAAELAASLASAEAALDAARTECSKAMTAAVEVEAEASQAAMALSQAQKSLEEMANRNPMQKFFGQLSGGPSEEDARLSLEEAKTKVATASEGCRAASVTDRQLWIKQYRAAVAVEAARLSATEKAAVIATQAAAVEAAKKAVEDVKVALGLSAPPLSGGITSEANLDERLADRRAWIKGYKTQGAPPPAPAEAATFDAASSEAAFADRLQDRRAWIAGYKAKNPAAVQKLEEAVGETGAGSASEATIEERVADRQAWVAAWRQRTGAKQVANA